MEWQEVFTNACGKTTFTPFDKIFFKSLAPPTQIVRQADSDENYVILTNLLCSASNVSQQQAQQVVEYLKNIDKLEAAKDRSGNNKALGPTKQAFSVAYKDLQQVMLFIAKIRNIAKSFIENQLVSTYLSPCFPMCQSSGYGKSRLIFEIANHVEDIYTFYVSFAASNSTAHPPRSPIAKHFVPKNSAHFSELSEKGQREEVDEIVGRFFVWCLFRFNCFLENAKSGDDSTPRKWFDGNWQDGDVNSVVYTKCSERVVEIWAEIEGNAKKLNKTELVLFFAFDEVKGLTSQTDLWFCSVRAILAQVAIAAPPGLRVCGTFADTTSKVTNLAPIKSLDLSARLQNTESMYKEIFDTTYIFRSTSTTLRYAGRPLWQAYKDSGVSERDLLQFAKMKLLGGWTNWSSHPDKQCAALAILSSRIALSIAPQQFYSSKLVSAYMGTCVGISKDHEMVQVEYPSEPILSEAAAFLMRDSKCYADCMQYLRAALSLNIINDSTCELVARLILTRCFDSFVQEAEPFFDSEVPVDNFLQTLINAKVKWNSNSPHLATGKVSFTHFVRVTQFPSQKRLEYAYERRVAFQLWHEAEAICIVIPVKLDEETFTTIVVQAKNPITTSTTRELLSNAAKVALTHILPSGVNEGISTPNFLPTKKQRTTDQPPESNQTTFPNPTPTSSTATTFPNPNPASGTQGHKNLTNQNKRALIVINFSMHGTKDTKKTVIYHFNYGRSQIPITGINIVGIEAFLPLQEGFYDKWISNLTSLLYLGPSIYEGLTPEDKQGLDCMRNIACEEYLPPDRNVGPIATKKT